MYCRTATRLGRREQRPVNKPWADGAKFSSSGNISLDGEDQFLIVQATSNLSRLSVARSCDLTAVPGEFLMISMDRVRDLVWPVIRRLLHMHGRFARDMTLGVNAVVIDADGNILLVRHTYKNGWHLPGGGVERGETIHEALKRELAEEAGVSLTGEAALFGVFFNSNASPRDHVALFVVRCFDEPGVFRRNTEILDRGFYSPENLPSDTAEPTRQRIAEVLKCAPISEHW
jgi:ADP-ribose pyrophosphatase YjhB (NUDIX family)